LSLLDFLIPTPINTPLKFDNLYQVEVVIKREDAIHPHISGNKFRKLKYNILEAQRLRHDTLLTFGGAFSNHIAAVASIGQLFGFKTIGVIRGEELSEVSNPTLDFAKSCGMQFYFVSREAYQQKNDAVFLDTLYKQFGNFYHLPEGGTNALAVKGCEEILTEHDAQFDYICCAVGTGGTISGLINSSLPHQKVLGFPALKGDFLREEIAKFAPKSGWDLVTDYHFGGYAKISSELISFINRFKDDYQIPLDPIYTGKLLFGVFDLIQKGYFPKGSKVLVIHTGGLQGIAGMNAILKQNELPLIR
jgi:1-aminocyclopropane-1-carboxylate deaminase